VHELFKAQARRVPHALAVDDARGTRLSYAALDRRVDQIAHALSASGVTREAVVGIHVDRSIDLAASVLGILSAGAAFVLLDPTLPVARLTAMLEDAAPRWLVTHRRLVPTLPGDGAERVILDELGDGPPAGSGRIMARGDDLAYVMYTSGSTGRPKGIAVSHRSLVNRIEWVRRTFPFTPDEVVCQKTSIGFIDTLWELLGPLADGVPCVLHSDDVTRDPAALTRVLEAHGVTRMMLVPSLLRALLRIHRGTTGWLPRLTLWQVGGEEFPADLATAFHEARPDARLVNLYGLSEVAGEATWHEIRDAAGPRVPIGVPGPNTRAYVVDVRGELAPVGVWGELWIGGAGVARGYLGRPDDTQARFVDDPFRAGGRAFRTGDRARTRSDGVLELAGRLDTQLKIRGVRVEPAEVEQALRRHPAVHDAAVTAVRALDGENRLVAYVTPEGDGLPEARELRQFLRASLAEPLVPTHIVALEALPLGPAGKLDLGALPAPDLRSAADAAQPLTATEAVVAEAWAAVLGTGPVGLEDDFFALGGYSLLVAQLAADLGRTFAIDVPLAVLFDASTVAAQAARIDEVRRVGPRWPALVRVPRSARMPLSFMQERMWFAEATRAGMPLHILTMALRLRGRLDEDRLERAMGAVAARHEALRTTFNTVGGVPYQEIHAHGAVSRDRAAVDLSTLAAAEQRAEILRMQADEKGRSFDLAAGPPWRTRLVRLGPEAHVLLVAMHHLVSDAWSMHRWIEEVNAHYTALPGQALSELMVQPADVAAWQRQSLENGAFDRARAYWCERLTRSPAAELPSDGPRDRADGAWLAAILTPAQTAAVRALARSGGASTFMVLLAALDLLVAELTGDEDVTIGTLVAGRDHPLVRPLIGVFLNTLPLRVNVRGATSLAEVLPRARDATRGALANGEVPFERIVADVNPVRSPRRNPLFDVALNYLPPGLSQKIGDLTVEFVEPATAISSPFDILWRVIERGDSLQLRVEYRHGQFSAGRVQTWLDRYLELLSPGSSKRSSVTVQV
jgi:amino acid adenylation domain-containing protein